MKEDGSPTVWEVLFSIKTFAAAALALFIAFCFDLPNPYWALTTVYIVAHPLSGASTSKAVYRLMGTIVGGVMTVILLPNLVNSPELLTLGISLWMGTCLALSLLDRSPRSYAFMLAGYTTALTSFPIVGSPETAFTYASSRVVEIIVAIICAAIISRVVFPRHAGPVLSARVDNWLNDGAVLMIGVLRQEKNRERMASITRKLAADSADLRSFTVHVSYDTSRHREVVESSKELQQTMVALLPIASGMADALAALSRATGGVHVPALRKLMEDISVWLQSKQPLNEDQETAFHELEQAVRREASSISPWSGMLADAITTRIRELTQVWGDCLDLQRDIVSGRRSNQPKRKFDGRNHLTPSAHVDYGMAVFSGFAAALATSLATCFWIATAWPSGAGAAMMAGILTCFFATADNATPILRKFLVFTLVSICGSFAFQFAVMPVIDGFIPLICALGLLFLPLGLLIAKPSTFLVGMAISTNIPSMLMLQSRASPDLETFINSNIATIIGIVVAICVASLVKSVGAEWSAYRLLRAGWSDIAAVAVKSQRSSTNGLLHRMVDRLGLIAPRLATLPADSYVVQNDVLKDLRNGLNTVELQRYKLLLPSACRTSIDDVLASLASFYQEKCRKVDVPVAGDLLQTLDRSLTVLRDGRASSAAESAGRALTSLRYSLFPEAHGFAANENRSAGELGDEKDMKDHAA